MPEQPIPAGVDQKAWLLAQALAAYNALMDEVVPESQYWQGKREDVDRVAYLGDIVERAAARRRELERVEST